MLLSMFCVMDSAVGAFTPPVSLRSRGEAVRSFQDACNDPQRGFTAHPEHYSFWLVGTFDDSTGIVTSLEPERICGALDFTQSK